jgi:hypothetical protein
MHWIVWDKLSIPKSNGGMDFRDMHVFYIALLVKQVWRSLTNPNSLCAQVLLGRYCHNPDLMDSQSANDNFKNLAGRQALNYGLIKRLGSGEIISIWEDSWLPKQFSMQPMGRLENIDLTKGQ